MRLPWLLPGANLGKFTMEIQEVLFTSRAQIMPLIQPCIAYSLNSLLLWASLLDLLFKRIAEDRGG
jgi:hypothetical protein